MRVSSLWTEQKDGEYRQMDVHDGMGKKRAEKMEGLGRGEGGGADSRWMTVIEGTEMKNLKVQNVYILLKC